MKWKFWQKTDILQNLDPHQLAWIMVQKMVAREFPFNKWRDEENDIPEYSEAFIEICVNVYQLSIFLDFIERKFGSDVAGIVKSHILALMKQADSSAAVDRFFEAIQIGRASADREQFFSEQPAVQVDCNIAVAFLRLLNEPNDQKVGTYPLLGRSLTLGRVSATAAFGGTVDMIKFRPETVAGLRGPENIPMPWSNPCGCFERQLKRRYMNPLFPPEKRRICTSDLIDAIARDSALLTEFDTDVDKILKEMEEKAAAKQKLTFTEVNSWREAVEELILRAAKIGDIANPQRDRLLAVYTALIKSMQDSCPPENRDELKEVVAASGRYQRTFANQFVAQMQVLPADEVVPALLTEDLETVRNVSSIIGEEARKTTYELAVRLIADAEQEGFTVADAESKLQALS